MSKERELLESCLDEMQYHGVPCPELVTKIKELLTQPEQGREPVAWRYLYSVNNSYTIFQQYPQGLADRGHIIEALYVG